MCVCVSVCVSVNMCRQISSPTQTQIECESSWCCWRFFFVWIARQLCTHLPTGSIITHNMVLEHWHAHFRKRVPALELMFAGRHLSLIMQLSVIEEMNNHVVGAISYASKQPHEWKY